MMSTGNLQFERLNDKKPENLPIKPSNNILSHLRIPRSYNVFKKRAFTCNECDNWGKILISMIKLLIHPRTLFIQLESWICIYILIHVEYLHDHLEYIGEAIDIRVLTTALSLTIIFVISQQFTRRERTLGDIAKLTSHIGMLIWTYNDINNNNNNNINELNKKQHFMYSKFENVISSPLSTNEYDTETKSDSELSTENGTDTVPTCKYNDDMSKICFKMLYSLSQFLLDNNSRLKYRLYSEKQVLLSKSFYEAIYEARKLCFNSDLKNEVFWNIHIQGLIETSERLCMTKLYKTPIILRSLSALTIYLLPIILAPYFVWHTDGIEYDGAASYFWAYLFFLLYGTLVNVQINLDDLFDCNVLDDIHVHYDEILELIHLPMN